MKFDSKTRLKIFWSRYKQKQQKPIRIQILRLLLLLMHMQQMLSLNELASTRKQRVAQK